MEQLVTEVQQVEEVLVQAHKDLQRQFSMDQQELLTLVAVVEEIWPLILTLQMEVIKVDPEL